MVGLFSEIARDVCDVFADMRRDIRSAAADMLRDFTPSSRGGGKPNKLPPSE